MLLVIGNKAIECYCYLPLQRAVLRIQYEHIGLSLGNQNITIFYVLAINTFTIFASLKPVVDAARLSGWVKPREIW